MLHRAGFTHNLAAFGAQLIAGGVSVVNGQCNMAKSVTQLVAARIPVVCQLNYGTFTFIALADKGQREAAFRIVLPAQQAHPQNISVEGQ